MTTARGVVVALAVVAVLALMQFSDAWGDVRQLVGRLSGGSSMKVPGGNVCADAGGTMAIRGYALALKNPTELAAVVRDNSRVFAHDGDAIACYRVLATALASNTNLSQLEALRDRAEAERQTGLEFDRSAYTTDLAGTLGELAGALPALANGDAGPYRATRAHESAQAYATVLKRTPGAAEGIDVLIAADEDVLRELAARVSGE